MNILTRKVLLLNASYEALGTISVPRAVRLIWKNAAEMIEADGDRVLRSPRFVFPQPSVVRLIEYIDVRGRQRKSSSTRARILARDHFRCRYCGKRGGMFDLTIDHILPASRDGVELAMIDTLVQAFLVKQFWTEKHMHYATTNAMATLTGQEREQAERFGGEWIPERVSEQEAIGFAALMADRWDRAFQRTLRALRDLQRYASAVTINNARQVNIATDGGQQVNVQRARKRAAARSTSSGAKWRRRGLKAIDL